MPVRSFICDVTSEPKPFHECSGCAHRGQAREMGCGHSPDVLDGISRMFREPGDCFSVTELLDCPRSVILKMRNNYGVKPSRAYWAFRGQIAHKIMEFNAKPGDISELRLFAELGGFKVSGQPDLIRDNKLYDWKTTKLLPEKPNEHHVQQLSFYRVLASMQESPIKIDHGVIVYIDMMRHKMFHADLMPIPIAKELMIERLKILNDAKSSGDTPSFEANFSTSNWKCGRTAETSYCEVRDICVSGAEIPQTTKRSVRSLP